MISSKSKLVLIVGLLLSCTIAPATGYYMQDFFPIGFTGFNHTHYWSVDGNNDGSPYPDNLLQYPIGQWEQEDSLLKVTSCNFIGCSDASEYYYLRAAPDVNDASHGKDFYTQVCLKSDPAIMMATNAGYTVRRQDFNDDGDCLDEGEHADATDRIWWALFKTPSYESGWAPDSFATCYYDEIPQDSIWCPMADSAARSYNAYFNATDSSDDYFWGYNPFHEAYAIYRGGKPGVYAACRYVTSAIREEEESDSARFAGKYRMIIGKHQLWPLMMQESGVEINLFEHVPEIDVELVYGGLFEPFLSYGTQSVFDRLLYGSGITVNHAGIHPAAVYMQKYGKTNLARSNQKRRWMSCVELNWEFIWHNYDSYTTETILSRRPCPPEIRCASYLALSRGAKGLLFVNYINSRYRFKDDTGSVHVDTTNNKFPTLSDIDDFNVISAWSEGIHSTRTGTLGLRDYTSKPCDTTIYSGPVLLDVDDGQTTYWDGKPDHTFGYICELIPEIKLLAPTLMELDWVNGYSLNSTDPERRSPCPHDYVMDVSGVSYMDLGLFDHPYEPVGVEYFMLVNREGIADMTNRTVTVALDANHWPEEDTLILTDIANSDRPRRLSREGDRFTFPDVFEPGEGKLYRAAPRNEAPVTLLNR